MVRDELGCWLVGSLTAGIHSEWWTRLYPCQQIRGWCDWKSSAVKLQVQGAAPGTRFGSPGSAVRQNSLFQLSQPALWNTSLVSTVWTWHWPPACPVLSLQCTLLPVTVSCTASLMFITNRLCLSEATHFYCSDTYTLWCMLFSTYCVQLLVTFKCWPVSFWQLNVGHCLKCNCELCFLSLFHYDNALAICSRYYYYYEPIK